MELDISVGYAIRMVTLDGVFMHIQQQNTRALIFAAQELQPGESVEIRVEAIRLQGNTPALQLTNFSVYSIRCSELPPVQQPIDELIIHLLKLAERPGDILVAIVDILSVLIDFANEYREGDLMGLLLEVDSLLEKIMPDGADPDSSGARLVYNIKHLIEILTPALPQEPVVPEDELCNLPYPYEPECDITDCEDVVNYSPYTPDYDNNTDIGCPPYISDDEDVITGYPPYTPDYDDNTDKDYPPYISEDENTAAERPYPECDGLIIGDPPHLEYNEYDYLDNTSSKDIPESTPDDTEAIEMTIIMRDDSDEVAVVVKEEDINCTQ